MYTNMTKLLLSIITLALMWPAQLQAAHASSDVTCQPHTSGFFCHPTDPGSYVICVGGFASLFHCSPGLHFDDELRQCVAPSDARCLAKLPLKPASATTPELHTTSSPDSVTVKPASNEGISEKSEDFPTTEAHDFSSAPINSSTEAPAGAMTSRAFTTNADNVTKTPVTTAPSLMLPQTAAGNATTELAGSDVTPSSGNVTGEIMPNDITTASITDFPLASNTSTQTGISFNVSSRSSENGTNTELNATTTLPAVQATKIKETVTTPLVNMTLALNSSIQVPGHNFRTTPRTDDATAFSTAAPVGTDGPKKELLTDERKPQSTTGSVSEISTTQQPSDHKPTAAAATMTIATETGQENVTATTASGFGKFVGNNETESVTTEPTTSANLTGNRFTENVTLSPRFTKTAGSVQTTAPPLAETTPEATAGQPSSTATPPSQESTLGVTEPAKPIRTQQEDALEAICSSTTCQLPSCHCVSTQPPAHLSPAAVPQMIILTVSGNVDRDTSEALESLFAGLSNPNSCSPKATFFVVGQWDDRKSLSGIVKARHELGLHSATHRLTALWWATAGYFNYRLEVKQWRDILADIAGVPKSNITGWRSPFIQLGSDPMFKVLKDTGLQYDSTMIAGSTNFDDDALPLWPFTLDTPLSSYAHHQVCTNEPCPHGAYPGLWEVPLNRLYSPDDARVSTLLDEFSNVHNSSAVQEMLEFNFQRHYTRGRAPFHVPMGEWVTRDTEARDGIRNFLQNALTSDDVWVVTTQQALAWMKQPLSTSLFSC